MKKRELGMVTTGLRTAKVSRQAFTGRFWRKADIYPSADFTQAPISKVGIFIQSRRRLAHESRRSACIAAELPWSEGTRDGLTIDLVDLLESVSSAMRFFGNCCSHSSQIAWGATTSDCRQENQGEQT
jgi:hypothetical protein